MRKKIRETILALIPTYLGDRDNPMMRHSNPDPYDINCGLCEDFAVDVIERVAGGENNELYLLWIEDIIDTPYPDANHAVVCLDVKGKQTYFDAECPTGTDDLSKLPVIANRGRLRPDVIAERGQFWLKDD